MTSKIVGTLALVLALLAPGLVLAQTTTGLVNVYVQVINPTSASYSPSNFTVNVLGGNPNPATFQGSQSGVLVTVTTGTYSVAVPDQYGFAASYSVGCNGTVLAGQTQLCVITLSGGNLYPASTVYPWTTAPAPLSCITNTPSVALGQAARFTTQGGVGGTYNWRAGTQNFPNVGPVLTTSFSQSGVQTVTVTNAGQTAVCTVTVLPTYAPMQTNTGFITYPNQVYTNNTVPAVTAYYPNTYPTVAPYLPNTGLTPSNGAELAFALVFIMGAAMISYPYARKAFAIAVR